MAVSPAAICRATGRSVSTSAESSLELSAAGDTDVGVEREGRMNAKRERVDIGESGLDLDRCDEDKGVDGNGLWILKVELFLFRSEGTAMSTDWERA